MSDPAASIPEPRLSMPGPAVDVTGLVVLVGVLPTWIVWPRHTITCLRVSIGGEAA
jgi:hypothetical protein